MKHTATQTDRIAMLLQRGRSITPIQALNQFGCFRLGARIHDLKKQGWRINKKMVRTQDGTHVAQYKLATP